MGGLEEMSMFLFSKIDPRGTMSIRYFDLDQSSGPIDQLTALMLHTLE